MFKKILIATLFSIPISYVLGFNIPDYNGYITDLTNTLSAEQINEISNTIENIKQSTSIEIAILIVPTIDGDNINLLATDIGNKRGVGKKDKDNGIIMLFAMEDRERSIQVGYGLEGTIPDAIAKRIGENNIVINFREGNYFNGIKNTLDELYLYIQKDPTIIQNYSKENTTTNREKINFELILFWLVIASIISRGILPKTKRKDKKRRTILSIIILGIGIILGLIISNLIISIIVGYIGMLFGIFGKGGGIVGGFGPGRFGGGSSGGFGGFGGGNFGGGGGGGRR